MLKYKFGTVPADTCETGYQNIRKVQPECPKISKKSHSAEKNKGEDPSDFETPFPENIKNKRKGDPFAI